jgi:single-strand DNA-binding protein
MPDVNSVALKGNLGKDPEVKYFESGKVVAKFSLACKRNRTKDTEWFQVEAWDKAAEFVGQYLKKGDGVCLVGSLKFDHWNDRDSGEARRRPVIKADSVEGLPKRGDTPEPSQDVSGFVPTTDQDPFVDSDIPF